MLKICNRKKGQGISGEYVLMIVLVSISLVAMTIYVRRAIQGRFRDANRMSYMKASAVLNMAVQPEYEPYYLNTLTDIDVEQTDVERVAANDARDKMSTFDRRVNSWSEQKPF